MKADLAESAQDGTGDAVGWWSTLEVWMQAMAQAKEAGISDAVLAGSFAKMDWQQNQIWRARGHFSRWLRALDSLDTTT